MRLTVKPVRSPGRRPYDKWAHDLVHILKLIAVVVGALATTFAAGTGAFVMGYSAWQEMKAQMARDVKPAVKPPPLKGQA